MTLELTEHHTSATNEQTHMQEGGEEKRENGAGTVAYIDIFYLDLYQYYDFVPVLNTPTIMMVSFCIIVLTVSY